MGADKLPVQLVLLAAGALGAVVLPRPPSSPNYIPQEYAGGLGEPSSKSYHGEKAMYQSTNVEKPDTQDYRYLEIEVRDADNVDSLDLHGLVQAVLDNQRRQSSGLAQRRLEPEAEDEEPMARNLTYPQPEVVPHSILGVRDVGLGPNQRLFEPTSVEVTAKGQHYLLSPPQTTKDLGDEKLYYLKSSRPKVYVNIRGRTGNFRQHPDNADSRATMRFEPAAFLRATPPYRMEKKTKSPKSPPKKYDARLHGLVPEPTSTNETRTSSATTTSSSTTTESAMVTSSELPKQIPAPPSRIPSRAPIVHTTPVQRYTARRSDILPGYAFDES